MLQLYWTYVLSFVDENICTLLSLEFASKCVRCRHAVLAGCVNRWSIDDILQLKNCICEQAEIIGMLFIFFMEEV